MNGLKYINEVYDEINMKVEPLNASEQEDPLVSSFGISKKEITEIVESYRSRKLAEDINYLVEHGGVQGLIEKLKTSKENGLSSSEDQTDRISVFGKNELIRERDKTYCEICWEAMGDTTLRILTVSGLVSLIIGAVMDEHPEYGWVEGFAIIVAVIVVVNVTAINDLQKQKKFNDLKEQDNKTKCVSILRDGAWNLVHPNVILVGDIIKLENGVTIPADGVIIESSQIEIVEAAMTGENENIKKLGYKEALDYKDEFIKENPSICDKAYTEDHHHEIPSPVVLSGTNLTEGIGVMIALAVGKNSAEGRIMELAEQEDEATPLMKKLDKLAGSIGKGGLGAAVITMIALYIRFIIEITTGLKDWDEKKDPNLLVKYFIIGITVLVVAIPEGLPLAVTISLAYSVKKMQVDNNLVRKMQACETMGGADMICSDKTGTLTQNKMTVSEFWAGGAPFSFDKNPPSHKTFQAEYLHLLKESIFTNSSAYIDPKKGQVGSKTEIAMLLLMLTLGHSDYLETRLNYFERFYKIYPFSSKRKRSSIVVTLEDGRKRVHVKGAAEVVARNCSHYINTEGILKKMDADGQNIVNTVIMSMTEKALRVIALAYSDIQTNMDIDSVDNNGFPLIESQNLTLVGLSGIRDPLRDEVPEAVRKCQGAGITVRMVTGDNKATARAIAKECFIITSDDQLVMEGKEFNDITGGTVCDKCKEKICPCARNKKEHERTGQPIRKDVVANFEQFKNIVKNLAVLARSSPDDKYTLVCGLRQMDHVVAVTGDGTNDAPALKKADIGFAMGIAGTETAKEAAGIILLDDNFNSIVRAVVWGRNVYDNIRCFLQFQLTVNVAAVILAMIGAITIQQSPLTSVQLLWVNLIMDSFASLALATDPPTDDHLKRKPHKRKDFIITKTMWKHIFGQATLQLSLMFAMVYAGELFLPEFDDDKYIETNDNNGETVICGRLYDYNGEELYKPHYDDPNYGPSRHFTYIFNVFVLLQLVNEINSRKLRDEFNIFNRIHKNWLFVIIWVITFFIQVFVVQVGNYAFSCNRFGLSVLQWLVCIGFSTISFYWRWLLLLIPSGVFPEAGRELSSGEMNSGILSIRASGLNRRHSYNLAP